MTSSDDRRQGERRVGGGSVENVEPLKQEVAANTVAILGVLGELREQRITTTSRVENLRVEQDRLRRVRAMTGAAGVFLMMVGYDEHIEHCSPGSRVTRGFNQILDTPIRSQAEQRELFLSQYNHADSWCDVMMPLHTHDGSSWPTQGNLVGVAMAIVLVVFWVTFHITRTRHDRDRAKQAVADDAVKAAQADRAAHWKYAQESVQSQQTEG